MVEEDLPRGPARRSGGALNMRRTFLLLQGPATPFFTSLAEGLRQHGCQVLKLNFNAGDRLYWRGSHAVDYSGRPSDLPEYLDGLYRRFGVTDQLLFGDRRPIHRPAVELGKSRGVRTHVYEEGYFRPYWVTLERQGVNGHSPLPRNPDWYWKVGGRLSEPSQPIHFQNSFHRRAIHDVLYHLAGVANPIMFPWYRTHAPRSAPLEYAGYAKRLPLVRFWHSRRDVAKIATLLAEHKPYFVLPLQLDSDAQIRDHSRFTGMRETIHYVMRSFAGHAEPEASLVMKNHPLSPGLVNYARVVRKAAAQFGVTDRVHYLETGDLNRLLHHAQGCITVNSTTGFVALALGCPTVTLSDPIYNMQGMTFQGSLDDFWVRQERPDEELFRRFRRVVLHAAQVEGGFYCQSGIALAVKNSVPIVTGERSPLEELL